MHKLASKPESIRKIERIVDLIDKKFNIDSETYTNILISLTEAVNNAILHGNCKDEEKYVHIKFKRVNDMLQFRVEDEGEGFNYKAIPNPTHPDNLDKCGGRGVFLMTQLCDRVKYHDNGSTVEMCFTL